MCCTSSVHNLLLRCGGPSQPFDRLTRRAPCDTSTSSARAGSLPWCGKRTGTGVQTRPLPLPRGQFFGFFRIPVAARTARHSLFCAGLQEPHVIDHVPTHFGCWQVVAQRRHASLDAIGEGHKDCAIGNRPGIRIWFNQVGRWELG